MKEIINVVSKLSVNSENTNNCKLIITCDIESDFLSEVDVKDIADAIYKHLSEGVNRG